MSRSTVTTCRVCGPGGASPRLQAGEVAGFGVPSRNTEFPVVGYLGVLPEHRGRGYVDEILAEITRILVADAGATTIHADTDLENRPMAAAFERCGYRVTGDAGSCLSAA